MILAEDELAIGTDHAGHHGARRTSSTPGTPLAERAADRHRGARARDHAQPPRLPRRLRRRARGPRRHRRAAGAAAVGRGPGHRRGTSTGVEVVVEAPDLCPRFTARVFEDVTIGPSPPWLKARLMAAGQRPINNVVDITNYVMLLDGPAAARLRPRPRRRRAARRAPRAATASRSTTLDGVRCARSTPRCWSSTTPTGRRRSPASWAARAPRSHEGTTRVLMEVANWDGPNIHRTSQRLGLRSEASGALREGPRARAGDGGPGRRHAADGRADAARGSRPGTIDVGGAGPPPAVDPPARARASRELLGRRRSRAQRRPRSCARSASASTDARRRPRRARCPHFRRNDVTREADLIEEVARIDGLEKLPATLPKRRGGAGRPDAPSSACAAARVDALVGRGAARDRRLVFTEPGAGRPPAPAAPTTRAARVVALENPMSEDQSVLRTTLLGSLLDAARHNARARRRRPRAVRVRRRLPRRRRDSCPHEHRALGGVLAGRAAARRRGGRASRARADFFAAKGLLGAVLDALRVRMGGRSRRPSRSCTPGAPRRVLVGGEDVGWLGELHPLVARALGPRAHGRRVFEIDLDRVVAHAVAVPRYVDLTSFPAVRLDLALSRWPTTSRPPTVRRQSCARRAASCWPTCASSTSTAASRWARGASRSALHLAFRAPDRTLTDEEVARAARARSSPRCATDLGGELRA